MPRPHPPELRRRAIELARERAKPIAEIAADMASRSRALRNWVHQAVIDEGGVTTECS